jgi:chemotaxis protein methyltransferase CheR
MELLRRERYEEALAIVETLPEDWSLNPDVLLLRAVLLTHRGNVNAAEDVCRTLLAIDDLNAGAHYLMALCCEGAIDPAGATHHDQVAIYLDPGFAAPRLHLGLLCKKQGRRLEARDHLSRALVLLEREDPSRLLFFGGGFGREALVALCRAELAASGGAP